MMTILLREVFSTQDLALIMAWRNITPIAEGSWTHKHDELYFDWETHYLWHKNHQHWKRWLIEINDNEATRPVGYVFLGGLDSWSPDIGYAIGEPRLWGQGIGKRAVSLALDWLKEHGYSHVHATVLIGNDRSLRLLKSLGFEAFEGLARKGEIYLTKNLMPTTKELKG